MSGRLAAALVLSRLLGRVLATRARRVGSWGTHSRLAHSLVAASLLLHGPTRPSDGGLHKDWCAAQRGRLLVRGPTRPPPCLAG